MKYRNKDKVRKFVRKNFMNRSESFRGDIPTLEKARDALGYSKKINLNHLADILNHAKGEVQAGTDYSDSPVSYPVTAKNNAGEKRVRPTYETIMKRSRYNFNSNLVRKMFDEGQYSEFVKKYMQLLSSLKRGRRWSPTQEELDTFKLYDNGRITVQEAMERLGMDNARKTIERMARVYAYKKEQESIGLEREVYTNHQREDFTVSGKKDARLR